MAQARVSLKQVAISKASAQMVIAAGIAGFVTVFCLVASQSLYSQNAYLNKVMVKKNVADKQLQADISANKSLVGSYRDLVSKPINAIGGSSTGTGANDGDNAKIILDALPSSYDFPALTASIEKILTDRNLKVTSITGLDDEVAQQAAASSPTPQAVAMNFSFVVGGANYASVQDVVKALQSSIRPIQIDTINISGGNNNMQLTVVAHTFYQPPKLLSIKLEKVQ